MILSMSHHRFLVVLAGFLWLLGAPGYAAEEEILVGRTISFDHISQQKNIDQPEGYILYDKLFGRHIEAPRGSVLGIPTEVRGSSLTSQFRKFEVDETQKSKQLHQTWHSISNYFRRNFTYTFLPPSDAAYSSPDDPIAQGTPLAANRITPKISFGKNYIEPTLCISNSLNSKISTEVSFKTNDKNLEASLSKKITKDVELTVINNNVFTQNLDKRVILGFKYRF